MKLFTCVILLIGSLCRAQDKQVQNIALAVNNEQIEKDLYYLAGEKLEGRKMGTHGDTLASEYIATRFNNAHVLAPYDKGKSYFQPITYYQTSLMPSKLFIGDKSYDYLRGWRMSTYENLKLDNIPVVFAGYGIETDSYNDFKNVDVKNKAVLLLTGQPKDSSGKNILQGINPQSNPAAMIAAASALLKKKGAAIILVYDTRMSDDTLTARNNALPVTTRRTPTAATNGLPVIWLSKIKVDELLVSSHKNISDLTRDISKTASPQSFDIDNKIGIHSQIEDHKLTAPNVIGIIKGTDTAAGALILSAHHDHLGKVNGRIFYGAVDNASGTVALMTIATLMNKAIEKGIRPKRTVVFASYTGEESGEFGSYFLADNPVVPIEKTWAVLNIDMMGRVDTFYSGRRPDSNYAYILVKDSLNRGLRTALLNANEKLGKLKLDPYYEQPQFVRRRLTGSDQYPFYLKGVPFIRIDCGFCQDYHKATDTPDKVNYKLLSDQIQLAFLTAWNVASD